MGSKTANTPPCAATPKKDEQTVLGAVFIVKDGFPHPMGKRIQEDTFSWGLSIFGHLKKKLGGTLAFVPTRIVWALDTLHTWYHFRIRFNTRNKSSKPFVELFFVMIPGGELLLRRSGTGLVMFE